MWEKRESLCTVSRNIGFPGGSEDKEFACNTWDPSSVPGFGRSPGEGDGYPLQHSCLENPMNRGAWWASLCGSKKQIWLSDWAQWECKLIEPLWKTVWSCSKIKNRSTILSSNSTSEYLSKEHENTNSKRYCNPKFIAASFTGAKTWRQPRV